MKRQSRAVVRKRRLTADEAAKYRNMREKVAAELPEISARVRERMEKLRRLGKVFADLRKEREARGLSLADVADRTGIDRSALSKLENGQRANFTLDTVMRYAQALGKEVVLAVCDPVS